MNSRLERLKVTIAKCEKIDEIFTKHRVRGQEAVYYDDLVAGFDSTERSGFRFNWTLVFNLPVHSRPDEEKRNAEPTCIEVALSGGEHGDRLFLVSYFPDNNIWGIEASTSVGGDGSEATRNLAADCRIGAGEFRRIGEDEAMKIIATLCAFFMSQPAG